MSKAGRATFHCGGAQCVNAPATCHRTAYSPVDSHDSEVMTPALGWLLIAAVRGNTDKTAIADLLGDSGHPFGALGEIAEALLLPLVEDALIAKAEDDEF
jgi:hypothetical protein